MTRALAPGAFQISPALVIDADELRELADGIGAALDLRGLGARFGLRALAYRWRQLRSHLVDRLRHLEDLVRDREQILVLLLLGLHDLTTGDPPAPGASASARFWLIITNVDRKIASSDTIIVSSPNG